MPIIRLAGGSPVSKPTGRVIVAPQYRSGLGALLALNEGFGDFAKNAAGPINGAIKTPQWDIDENGAVLNLDNGKSISIANSPDTRLTDDFTVLVAFRYTGLNNVSSFLADQGFNSGSSVRWLIRHNFGTPVNKLTIYLAGADRLSSTSNITDALPHVVVFRRREGTLSLWMDGVQEGSVSSAHNITNSDPLVLGERADQTGVNPWSGTINLFAIWPNTGLSDHAVQLLTARPYRLFAPKPVWVYIAPPGGQQSSGSTAVTGTGTVSVVGAKGGLGSGSIATTGAVAATGAKVGQAAPAVTATGAVAVAAAKTGQAAADVISPGAATAAGQKAVFGTAVATGTGTVTATGYGMAGATATVTGAGVVAAAGAKGTAAGASVAGVPAIAVSGRKVALGAAGIAAIGAVAATVAVFEAGTGAATVSAIGAVTASGIKRGISQPAVTDAGAVVTTAFASRFAAAALAAPGAVVAVHGTARFITVAVSATGTVTVTGTIGALAQMVEVVALAGKWEIDVSLLGKAG